MIGSRPVTADDYRRLARGRLPRFLFDYIDGGAGEEQSLAANREGLKKVPSDVESASGFAPPTDTVEARQA